MNALYFTPFVGATIGYFTNWLAIKMIFRPYEEKRIFGVKVPFTPGLIAVERERITTQIGYVITNHLLTNDDLKNKILTFEFDEHVLTIINSLELHIKENDQSLEDFLKTLLKDDYEIKLSEIKSFANNYLTNSFKAVKSAEDIEKLEKDLSLILPDILEIVKTVFEKNMYNIDAMLMSFFDEMIAGLFQGFGALLAGFVSSEKLYSTLQNKIVSSIDDDKEGITNKIVASITSSKDTQAEDFSLENITDVVINNLLSKKISNFSAIFELLKKDSVVSAISTKFKTYLANEINTILSNLDINNLILAKMDEMPLSEIEALIMTIAKREIKAITNIGGVLGFIIGLLSILFY